MQNFIYKSVHITVYPTWIYLERFLWLFELKFWNVVVWVDIIIVIHKEWDWDLAFAFLATDLGSVSTLVALRNSLGDLQDSDIAFRNEFNTIALFQALKFRINLYVCVGLLYHWRGFSVSLCVSSMAWDPWRSLKDRGPGLHHGFSWLSLGFFSPFEVSTFLRMRYLNLQPRFYAKGLKVWMPLT